MVVTATAMAVRSTPTTGTMVTLTMATDTLITTITTITIKLGTATTTDTIRAWTWPLGARSLVGLWRWVCWDWSLRLHLGLLLTNPTSRASCRHREHPTPRRQTQAEALGYLPNSFPAHLPRPQITRKPRLGLASERGAEYQAHLPSPHLLPLPPLRWPMQPFRPASLVSAAAPVPWPRSFRSP